MPISSRKDHSFKTALKWFGLLALLVLLSAACAPSTDVSSATPRTHISVPELTLLEEGTRIERFDPPGAGSLLTLQIEAQLHNPNDFPVTVTAIDYTVAVERRTSTQGQLQPDVWLGPHETVPLQLLVETPLGRNPELLRAAVRAFAGRPLSFRVDGSISFENESHEYRSASRLLFEGGVLAREAVLAPTLELLPADSDVFILGPDEPVIRLIVVAGNPGDIGYFLHGKDLTLNLAGQFIAVSDLRPTPVPARNESRLDLLFYPDLKALTEDARAVLSEALAGTAVAVELQGSLFMDVLGLDSFSVPEGWSVQGTVSRD